MANFNIKSNISDVTGQFSSFASILSGGVKNAIATVNTSLLTLAANPIGAILAAVGVVVIAITASLSKLQPVVDEINVRVAQLSAAWSFLVDTVGSYLGIADAPARSFADTVIAAGNLERATIAAADASNTLIVRSAELRAEQRALALEAADATLSTEERVAALERAEVATRSLFDLQRTQLDEEIRILETQQSLGSNTREDNEELARLQASRIDLNAMESSQLMAFTAQRTGLQKAQQAIIDMEAAAAKAEIVRVRELRQEREIDLKIAGGATEEEVFQLRIDRAETAEEVAAINHDKEIARLEAIREREMMNAADKMKMDMAVAEEAKEAEEAATAATQAAEDAKTAARQAAVGAAIGFITGLLGDSKGAMIAGLLATNAFEAANILAEGTAATNTANAYALSVAAVPILGQATTAALPLQVAGIAATTSAGLGLLGVQTGLGIANILATPGASPSGGAGGGGGGGGGSLGPTVTVPDIQPMAEGPSALGTSLGTSMPMVAITPAQGPGSLTAAMSADRRRQNRRIFNNN